MNRLILFCTVASLFQPLMCLADSDLQKKSDILISNGEVFLKEDVVLSVFKASRHEKQNAIISHPKRYQKFIENRWIEQNLIHQVKKGALPNSMPDMDVLMNLVRQTTIAKAMIERLAEAQKPSLDVESKNRYQSNLSAYKMPDQVKASHILIKAENRTDEEAKKLAEKIRELAVSGKQDFESLAEQYSEDPSVSVNHGNLGFFKRGQMTKPFEDAAFSLINSGQISPVVKSQFGYHVIRLEKKRIGKIKSFQAVKQKLKKNILAERQQQLWKDYLKKADEQVIVSQEEIDLWLWFGGIKVNEAKNSVKKEIKTKLSIAKLLTEHAQRLEFDQQQKIQNKLEKEKRKALVKLRRKALYDEIFSRDLSNAIEEHYRFNKQRYATSRAADVSIIMLSNDKHTVQEINKLEQTITQSLDNGEEFNDLALKYSDASNINRNQGNIGLVTSGKLSPQLDKAIFSQTQIGLLKPVKTSDGIFIVNINKIIPGKQLSLEEVRDSIKASIANELANAEYSNLVHSILNDSGNQVNDQVVDRLWAKLNQVKQ